MEKFCHYCGKELINQECSCQEFQDELMAKKAQGQANGPINEERARNEQARPSNPRPEGEREEDKFNEYAKMAQDQLKETSLVFMDLIRKPVSTIKKSGKIDGNSPFILAWIHFLSIFLYGISFPKQLPKFISGGFGSKFGNMFGFGGIAGDMFKISFFSRVKTSLLFLIAIFIIEVIIILCVYIVIKSNNKEMKLSFLDFFKSFSLAVTPATIAILIGFIFNYIFIKLGAFMAIIALVIWFIQLANLLRELGKLDGDKAFYITLCIIVVNLILLSLFLQLITKSSIKIYSNQYKKQFNDGIKNIFNWN